MFLKALIYMNITSLFIVLFVVTFSGFIPQEDWKFVEKKDQVEIFTKVEENGKKWIRLSTVIPASINEVVNYTSEIDKLPNWVYACQNSKVYSDTENETTYYTETDLPFPMSDRYCLVKKNKVRSPDGLSMQTISENYAEKEIDSDLVRVTEFKAIWNFEHLDAQSTRVTYDFYTAATLPSWLQDKISMVGPFNTLLNLRKQFL